MPSNPDCLAGRSFPRTRHRILPFFSGCDFSLTLPAILLCKAMRDIIIMAQCMVLLLSVSGAMPRGPSGQPLDRRDGQVIPVSAHDKGGPYGKTTRSIDRSAEIVVEGICERNHHFIRPRHDLEGCHGPARTPRFCSQGTQMLLLRSRRRWHTVSRMTRRR